MSSDPEFAEMVSEVRRRLTALYLEAPASVVDNLVAHVSVLIEHGTRSRDQVQALGHFIMDEFPGEPSQSQGAVDTAIRIISTLLAERDAWKRWALAAEDKIDRASRELGVPGDGYPAPVANAVAILNEPGFRPSTDFNGVSSVIEGGPT